MSSVPEMGTTVPEMGTTKTDSSLAGALFGKTRREILGMLYSNPDRTYHLRQIIDAIEVGHGSTQRELKRLVEDWLRDDHPEFLGD